MNLCTYLYNTIYKITKYFINGFMNPETAALFVPWSRLSENFLSVYNCQDSE